MTETAIPLGPSLLIPKFNDKVFDTTTFIKAPYYILETEVVEFKPKCFYDKLSAGQIFNIDKTGLEELVRECQLKFGIKRGYYILA
jgi:hypothetical protein